MKVLFGMEHAIIAPERQPGAFEWWYVDAWDERHDRGIVLICFDGAAMAPGYVTASRRGREMTADRWPAVVLSSYHGTRRDFYSFRLLPPDSVERSLRDGVLRISAPDFLLQLDAHSGTGRVSATGRSKLGLQRFSCNLAFHAGAQPPPAAGHSLVLAEARHAWNPIWPTCTVDGELTVNGRTADFHCPAYIDHNAGDVPLHEEAHPWYWGRMRVGNQCHAYYSHGASLDRALLLSWEDGNEIRRDPDASFYATDLSRTAMGLPWARTLQIDGGHGGMLVRHRHILDYGPFYLRFRAEMTVYDGDEQRTGIGIAEYLHPSRLSARIFHPFINMRITNHRRRYRPLPAAGRS